MAWLEVLSIIGANAGLFLWTRSESKSDWRHMDAKIDANHRENREIIESIRQDMKDFHGRMCAIEERRKCEK